MSRFLAAIFEPIKLLQGLRSTSGATSNGLMKVDNFLLTSVRTKVRCYFPRPNEVKRVRRHGWEHRMSTPGGRKTIMRKILRGKFVLSH